MFAKQLKVIYKDTIVLEEKIVQIFDKLGMFLPNDKFILFNPLDQKIKIEIPKKSQLFINNKLIGRVEASGTIDIKSDTYNGLFYAVYIS